MGYWVAGNQRIGLVDDKPPGGNHRGESRSR
jgi:hypothetical protein